MTYSRARGRVGAYMRGSPDGMRPEPGRGAATIDDPYTDGVSITAWTPEGRKHLATYTVGLSYSNRDFSYYLSGNCLCHAGGERTLPPPASGSLTRFLASTGRPTQASGPGCRR